MPEVCLLLRFLEQMDNQAFQVKLLQPLQPLPKKVADGHEGCR